MRDSFFVKQRDLDGQFPQPTYFWHSCQIRDKARWGVKCFQTFAFTISGCWPNIDPCDLICWHVLISFPTCLTFTPRTSDPPSLATCEHQFYWPRFLLHQYQIKTNMFMNFHQHHERNVHRQQSPRWTLSRPPLTPSPPFHQIRHFYRIIIITIINQMIIRSSILIGYWSALLRSSWKKDKTEGR